MSKETSLAALDNCFTDFSDLIQGFSEDDWGMQSLCPDWDIRGVVTHLAGIENLLLGWVPKSADEWPPFCLLYTSPSPRDYAASRMPSSA